MLSLHRSPFRSHLLTASGLVLGHVLALRKLRDLGGFVHHVFIIITINVWKLRGIVLSCSGSRRCSAGTYVKMFLFVSLSFMLMPSSWSELSLEVQVNGSPGITRMYESPKAYL